MPKGKPLYTYDDVVTFPIKRDEKSEEVWLTGTIGVVDANGYFFDNSQPFYDIMVKPDPLYGEKGCFYKHIPEDTIKPAE